MKVSPSSALAPLYAGKPSRSPEGTAMLAGLTGKHIAKRAGLGRPGARPGNSCNPCGHCVCGMDQ
jgi:hypothetical protein